MSEPVITTSASSRDAAPVLALALTLAVFLDVALELPAFARSFFFVEDPLQYDRCLLMLVLLWRLCRLAARPSLASVHHAAWPVIVPALLALSVSHTLVHS